MTKSIWCNTLPCTECLHNTQCLRCKYDDVTYLRIIRNNQELKNVSIYMMAQGYSICNGRENTHKKRTHQREFNRLNSESMRGALEL